MRSKLTNKNYYWQLLSFTGIILSLSLSCSKSHAANQVAHAELNQSALTPIEAMVNPQSSSLATEKFILASLPVLPQTAALIKTFEGFRNSAYLDTSGLPVIGYGQTRVNGKTVTMGQSITQAQADLALEQELAQIQKLVLSHVKVDLNPYQLGALTSLVYNTGTVVIKDSTLIKKLNAGDYLGAAQEFVRWNKAYSGGKLVVFPGLTKRRIAEQKLFLTPHEEVASNN